jgi:NAD(P)-dependent dehydrogenase (short-subunit alcohol dehydrogenase family)
MRFTGKVAVVTGAASGIGDAVARSITREGGRLVAVDWRPDAVSSALGSERTAGEVVTVGADVTDPAAVDRMITTAVSAFGRIDILVNSAGIVEGDDLLSISPDVWDRNVDSVLKSVYLCSRAVLPIMIAANGGSIVNIASVNGILALGDDAYSAAKAGVINLTKAIAVRYGSHGVRCNAVAPADVRTSRWEGRLRMDPEILARLSRRYPLRRIGEPQDIAEAVAFLASDAANWITGTVLVVDGGLLAGNEGIMADAYPVGATVQDRSFP